MAHSGPSFQTKAKITFQEPFGDQRKKTKIVPENSAYLVPLVSVDPYRDILVPYSAGSGC